MPSEPIPFSAPEAGFDEVTGALQARRNVMVDMAGNIRSRPGIVKWSDFPATIPNASPVIGMTAWQGKLVYVTNDRKIYVYTASGSVNALSGAAPASQLEGGGRPRFATTKTRLIMAGGGALQKWEGALGVLAARLGGTPPSYVSDVLVMAQRAVALEVGEGGLFYWSGVGDTNHQTWVTSEDVQEAEARPDKIIAIRDNGRELFAFGSQSTQVYGPDPDLVFSPVTSLDIGCAAADGIIRHDDQFAWLDNRRRFILSDVRNVEETFYLPVARPLDGMTRVDDCWGFREKMQDFDQLVWVFPTDGRTLAYDMKTKAWCERDSMSGGVRAGWTPQSYYYWEEKNLHLAGMADGSIARLDLETYSDLGTDFLWQMRTGFQDRGVDAPKWSQKLTFHMRRGDSTLTTEPFFWLRWRDDLGAFTQPVRISIGTSTERAVSVTKWSLGKPYIMREWEIYGSSPALLSIARVVETFQVLSESEEAA